MGSYIRDSKIIQEEFDSHFINISTSAALREIGWVSPGKIVRYVSMWMKLSAYLLKHGRPDLVFITPAVRGMGLLKELPLLCFVRLLNRPLVSEFHNRGLDENLKNRKLLSRIIEWVFKRDDSHAAVTSNRQINDVQTWFKRANVHVVYYGIPVIEEKYMNQPRSGNTVIFLSNLIVSKGILDYLDACRILKERGVDIKAQIVGGEAELSRLDIEKEIDKRGLGSICSCLGPRYGEEKYGVLGSSDIFVFPTYYPYETFGLVNIEAMACGLPVIATDQAGIPELVEDGKTGYIVPVRTPDAIAEKIQLLLDDPDLRADMARAARQRYLEKFTVQHFTRGISSLIAECADVRHT